MNNCEVCGDDGLNCNVCGFDPGKSSASPTCSIDGGDAAQDALNRMKWASGHGTGCHLTAEMINGLRVTLIGSILEEEDPRQ